MANSSNSAKRRRLVLIVVSVFAISAVLAVLLRPVPNLFSAPAIPDYTTPSFPDHFSIRPPESRNRVISNNFMASGVVGSPGGFVNEVSIPGLDLPDLFENWPPDEPLPHFTIDRQGADIAIVESEPDAAAKVAPELLPHSLSSDIHAEWDGSVTLPGNARLRLVAFALSYPLADDPIDLAADETTEQLLFRETEDLDLMKPEDLAALGVPARFQTAPIAGRDRPQLRLLLKSESLPAFRSLGQIVYDERTLREVGDGIDVVSEGNWHAVDFRLEIWHDTHLKVGIELLTGKIEEAELPLETNQQVSLGDRVRVGFLFAAPGDLAQQKWVGRNDPFANPPAGEPEFGDFTLSGAGGGSSLVLLGGNDEFPGSKTGYWQNCAVLPPTSEPDNPLVFLQRSREGYQRQRIFQEIVHLSNRDLKMGDTVRLGFFPYRTRVWFELPTLPDMPNGREVENLFDVRIPRATVTPGVWATPGHGVMKIVSDATEFDCDSWAPTYFDESEPTLTLIDKTPRELLQLCLESNHRAQLTIKPDIRIFGMKQREPWTDRVKLWWAGLWPDSAAP